MEKKYIKLILIIIIGALLGVLSSISDTLPFGSAPFILGGFINTASFWSLVSFFIGTRFRSRKNSMIAPVGFLSLSVITYYLFGHVLSNRGQIPLGTLLFTSLSWIIISFFIGSLCGLAGRSAKFTKDLKKRMIAVVIPMVIVLTESIIAILQISPYLNSNNSNYIPFGILISLTITSLMIPFLIFKNKRVALYTMFLGVIVASIGTILLIALSQA